MNTVVSSALSVPGAIKDYLYPSISFNSKKSTEKLEESSSSGDEDYQAIGWLQGKRQSGMKLVYGLLGGAAGSPSIALENEDEEEDDEDDVPVNRADEAEVLDDRTVANFRKYFVLPETEKLLTGKNIEHTHTLTKKLIYIYIYSL